MILCIRIGLNDFTNSHHGIKKTSCQSIYGKNTGILISTIISEIHLNLIHLPASEYLSVHFNYTFTCTIHVSRMTEVCGASIECFKLEFVHAKSQTNRYPNVAERSVIVCSVLYTCNGTIQAAILINKIKSYRKIVVNSIKLILN